MCFVTVAIFKELQLIAAKVIHGKSTLSRAGGKRLISGSAIMFVLLRPAASGIKYSKKKDRKMIIFRIDPQQRIIFYHFSSYRAKQFWVKSTPPWIPAVRKEGKTYVSHQGLSLH